MGTLLPQAGRALPWGFLGMLALIGAAERYVFHGNLAFGNNGIALHWRYTAKNVRRVAPGREILCFGDCMMQFGVNPRVLQERTGRSAANLALMGGSAASSYFLLHQALDAGAHPATVLVDFHKDLFLYEPGSTKDDSPWHELLTLRDLVELCRVARDPGLFVRIVLNQLLPSSSSRSGIRAYVQSALKGAASEQEKAARSILRNLNRNHGALVLGKADFEDTPAQEESSRMISQWQPVPAQRHYLRKFFALAEAHRLHVVWLLLPLSPGTQAAEDLIGNERRFETLVHSVQRRHANVHVLDARHPGLNATSFHDRCHLDRDGMLALSNAVAGLLGRDAPELTSANRWVVLPASREPSPLSSPLEDVEQSWLAVNSSSDGDQQRQR